MRKFAGLLTLIMMLVMVSPTLTYAAADRTLEVSGSASSVQFRNTALQVYPSSEIDRDDPEYNLCRVEVFFRTAQNLSVYRAHGDTVSFFIKSSRDAEIAWVDKNANGDYETSEMLTATSLAGARGAYVQNARMTKSGSVIIYIGSQLPGNFTVTISTDRNGEPGQIVGSQSSAVTQASGTIILTPTDYKGISTLSGTGTIANPYKATAGKDIGLRAKARTGSYLLIDKKVTYRMYSKATGYEEIGTAETDDEGIAILGFEAEKAGLYSFQAFVQGLESEEIYINFQPDIADSVEAKTVNKLVVPQRVITQVEFYVMDDNDNVIDSKGQNIVEFSITGEPAGSKYFGFTGRKAPSDKNGVAVFDFEPDLVGRYTVTCSLIGGRDSDSVDLNVVYFGKVTALAASLKADGQVVPSVKYTDKNNDGTPDEAGRLEIRLLNKDGAAKLAAGMDLYNLDFTVDGEAVTIGADGSVTVLEKDFRGTVPVTIYDRNSQVFLTYNLKITGQPVAVKSAVEPEGKKAIVTVQYVDSNGNATYGVPGEELTVATPSGVTVTDAENFDQTGKATFVLGAAKYDKYDISVLTRGTRISGNFFVRFEASGAAKAVPGARHVVMFLGQKTYTQDSQPKLTDVAPFIKDGRTFVAIRPVADAFGAVIDWNPSSQTVTLTRSDLIVTIVIGSNRITVVRDGQTTVIPTDVAAFIQDGRTVLPFRAVGDAFGATINFDAASQAVSYAQ